MSDRTRRRRRHRAEQQRAKASRQIVDQLLSRVNQLGGTPEERSTLEVIRDWQHAIPVDSSCKTTSDPSTGQSVQHWFAVHSQSAPVSANRSVDDGLLLIVPVHIFGKKCRALIDSGATRCFMSPECVVRCGVHTVHEEIVLELADGRKLLSQGKTPHS